MIVGVDFNNDKKEWAKNGMTLVNLSEHDKDLVPHLVEITDRCRL